ncbi:hypothetical protein JL101_015635 [Skermanella rosea]|uniref:hypothetical protein n=1 Tax=Skermanella rosea TaxID=1817965 RepID=UPI00193451A2|nr:hypothetical protein [Skermanella rosea]UEM01440.1 hypothetical protein JL101_015635 [Skermanella rosea]
MRMRFFAAALSLVFASSAALAQTTTQAPANPSNDAADRPLMTAPQPGDQTTTERVAPTPGISGEAPSRELTGQGNTGVPGGTPQAEDAPAEMTGPGEAQSESANPPPAAGTPPATQPPQR